MGKFAWGVKAKLKTLLGPLSTNFWKHQCFFAFTPQPNFSTKNLKFYWRWWDQIQSIFLHLFYFNIQNGTPRFANFWTSRSRNTFPLVVCCSQTFPGFAIKWYLIMILQVALIHDTKILSYETRAEFCQLFRSFFRQWSFKTYCFWDLLTFSGGTIKNFLVTLKFFLVLMK